MIINEFISNVFNSANASTDDFGISRRWIYNEARPVRAELIKQEFNKNRLYNGLQAQPLEDVKLSATTIATYPILKSDLPIPKIIECDTGLTLDGVYTKSGSSIVLTDKSTWQSKKGRRFARESDSYAFIFNHYLYIDGFLDLNEMYVDLPGYFDDPLSVAILSEQNGCDNNQQPSCKAAYEYDFYIPSHIERRVVDMVRNVVFRKLGIPTDVENNDKLDIQSNVSNQVQPSPQRFS